MSMRQVGGNSLYYKQSDRLSWSSSSAFNEWDKSHLEAVFTWVTNEADGHANCGVVKDEDGSFIHADLKNSEMPGNEVAHFKHTKVSASHLMSNDADNKDH